MANLTHSLVGLRKEGPAQQLKFQRPRPTCAVSALLQRGVSRAVCIFHAGHSQSHLKSPSLPLSQGRREVMSGFNPAECITNQMNILVGDHLLQAVKTRLREAKVEYSLFYPDFNLKSILRTLHSPQAAEDFCREKISPRQDG